MANRYQTLTYTTASIAGSGTSSAADTNQTIAGNQINIVSVVITANSAGGTFDARIYKRDTLLAADLLAHWDNVVLNLYDPMDNSSGSPAAAEEGPPIPYDDDDSTTELHLQITNNDTSAHTYTVTVLYEEVPLVNAGSDFTFPAAILIANGAAGTPSISFTNSTTTGFFRQAADVIGLAIAGTERYRFSGAGTGISFVQDNADDLGGTSTRIRTGYFGTRVSAGLATNATGLFYAGADGAADVIIERATTDSGTASVIQRKARGTNATRTVVASADTVASWTGQGFDGSNYQDVARISFAVDGAPGANDMPGRIVFLTTPDASVTPSERVRIDSTGNVLIAGTAINSGTNQLNIYNGTAPTGATANSVAFYSSDISDGHTEPSFYCEGTSVLATGQADSASSVRVRMRINGTEVTLLAI